MSAPSPNRVERVRCDACGVELLANEAACWKCGASTARRDAGETGGLVDFAQPTPAPASAPSRPAPQTRTAMTLTGEVVELPDFSIQTDESARPIRSRHDGLGGVPARSAEMAEPEGTSLADFSAPASPARCTHTEDQPPATRFATTLTGEVVELPDLSAPSPLGTASREAEEEAKPLAPAPGTPVMRLTYCKTCGLQNDETAVECRKCKQPLEIISEPIGDVGKLRRSWGFDLLGMAWLVLGIAAVYCGQFIVKADPKHPGITWADYFWTGIVVCAPGVLVFLRHYFCKFLFWLLMFSSLLVWSVIGFIWLYIGLHVTDNGIVGLMWLGALSGLSLISYITVRLNDEFDYGT